MKYNAFISYSHENDSPLASNLEKALEGFAKSTFKRRALTLFRDQNNLSASPDLWGKIEEGLSNSEYFIFLASPKSGQSIWCNKEVDFWIKNKPIENLLIAITDGELLWDEEQNDFDWSKTNSVPKNLSKVFKSEPLYVDFRDNKIESEQHLSNTDFRAKTVLLAATIHGKSVEDMDGEGIKQFKKTIRIRNSAIFFLSALLLASLILAFYAFNQRNFALNQRNEAEKQRQTAVENEKEAKKQKDSAVKYARKALVNSYLADAKAAKDIDPTISMKLSEYGYAFTKKYNLDTLRLKFEDQLIETYNLHSNFYLNTNRVDYKGKIDLTLDSFPGLKWQDLELTDADSVILETNEGVKKVWLHIDDIMVGHGSRYAYSPAGNCVFHRYRGDNAGYNVVEYLSVHDLKGKSLSEVNALFPEVNLAPKFSADGDRILLASQNQVKVISNINSTTSYGEPSVTLSENSVECVALSKDGKYAAVGMPDGTIILYDGLGAQHTLKSWALHGHRTENIQAISFSNDNQFLLSKSRNVTRKWRLPWTSSYIELLREISYQGHYLAEYDTLTKNPEWQMLLTDNNNGFNKLFLFNSKKDTIQFIELSNGITRITSKDGRFYATETGLYNSQNVRLIKYKSGEVDGRSIKLIKFSTDGNYLLAYNKIYCINPEIILKDFHRNFLSEKEALFTKKEKERFLIIDED